MTTQTILDNQFETEVLNSNTPVLVDFYAEWCGPCKAIAPALEEISEERSEELKIVKMNIEESPDAPTKYGVRGVPTFMIFKDGQVIDTKIGGMSKSDMENWIDTHK